MQQEDTIGAVSTPMGIGGIGIVRLSGNRAVEIAGRIFSPYDGKKLEEATNRQAIYGKIIAADGCFLDEALCIVMRAPHSYTREDVVEIQCHGGAMPLKKILALSFFYGARPAAGGEFTKRAFLNGRLDLSQAQAVMDIIEAKTDSSLRMAAGHLKGIFSQNIRELRQEILAIIAHLEAVIDFPEDDIDEVVVDDVERQIIEIQKKIKILLSTSSAGRILRDGLETAIIGKPNVGKSSLLNHILCADRAIVTDIPGTTRDSIEEYADVGGIPLRIIDTAGIRQTDNQVEKIGVAKTKEYIEHASLILALFDSTQPLSEEDKEVISMLTGKKVILLLTKSDLPQVLQETDFHTYFPLAEIINISTVNGQGLAKLKEAILQLAYAGTAEAEESSFVSNARQADILQKVYDNLSDARETIQNRLGLDFIVIDLRAGWHKLGEITGDTVGEDIIDQIFSRFCIGK